MDIQNEVLNLLKGDDSLSGFEYYFNNFGETVASPEKLLMMSVLISAVIDYLAPRREWMFVDAEGWFYNPPTEEEDYMFSFENIAYVLKINPSRFLSKLKERKASKADFALDGKRVTVV